MYFAHPIDFFCLTNFEKKYEFIRYGFFLVWVLVLILIRAILEQSINKKMVSKIWVGMSTTDMCYTNTKFIVICKPYSTEIAKKHYFLAAAILIFIGKIIISW